MFNFEFIVIFEPVNTNRFSLPKYINDLLANSFANHIPCQYKYLILTRKNFL